MTGPMINHERLKQRRTEGSRGGAGWKPKEGENRVRILPPGSKYLTAWETMEDIAVSYEMHFFRIEGRQPTEVTRCPRDLKLPCPACDAYWAHYKSSDPGLKELAKQIKSTRVYLMNLLDISNLGAGIQRWGGNYTCWDKILEIVANPAWGNVLDPANGVNFFINLTPANRSRTGFPQYSVTPEPQKTTVMEILAAIPEWQAQLDALEEQVTPMKTAVEIQALLDAMRVPPAAGQPTRIPAAAAARPIAPPAGVVAAPAVAPVPVAAPQPVAVPAATPAPVQVSAPGPVPVAVPAAAPVPVSVAAPAPTVVTGFQEAAPAASSVHYDPGPNYVPKVPDAVRPAGAPCCFGDYNPAVHQCQPCPIKGSCQMKMLGIA